MYQRKTGWQVWAPTRERLKYGGLQPGPEYLQEEERQKHTEGLSKQHRRGRTRLAKARRSLPGAAMKKKD